MSARAWLRSHARDHALDTITRERAVPEWKLYGTTCERCGSERPTGAVRGGMCECERERERELIADFEREHLAEYAGKVLEEADLPRRYAGCSFDGFEVRQGTEEAYAAAQAWADGFTLETETGLFLAGPFGAGKTHLAVAALRRAVERTLVDGRYVSAGDLVAQVRGSSGINWRPVEDAIRAELLVLDDLGMEAGTEFTRDVQARVLFARYEAARPTIVTSNHGPKAITQIYGGAITSRLREMTDSLVLTASDYRAQRKGGR